MHLYKGYKKSIIFEGYTFTACSTFSKTGVTISDSGTRAAVVCRKAYFNFISPDLVISCVLINPQFRVFFLPAQFKN